MEHVPGQLVWSGLAEVVKEVIQSEVGEFSKTFFGVLGYILKNRPRIIILENVQAAPWDAFAKNWFDPAGYLSNYVKADTQNYWLPQTRTRGYTIAADRGTFDEEVAQKIVDHWTKIMVGMESKLQAELSLFVRHKNHPATEAAPQFIEGRLRARKLKQSDAPHAQIKHKTFRIDNDLDLVLSPYSNVDARHYPTPRDDTWRDYLRAQLWRALDNLDILFLTGLKANFDITHKPLIYDLYQTPERRTRQMAISPCVTPSGQFFISDQGRPLLGIEAMALQGMPMDQLVPSVETNGQLQDMAGNAMSTTVVGTAILAAVISQRLVCGLPPAAAQTQVISSGARQTALRMF